MAIKPILFSTPMIQAILAGRKTQTRRVVKVDSALEWLGVVIGDDRHNGKHAFGKESKCYSLQNPKYQTGDILWVRETWQKSLIANEYCYKADTDNPIYLDSNWKWKPSIHMPKEAARIFLKVTDVKVERVLDFSEEDAKKEGCTPVHHDSHISAFIKVFNRIYGNNMHIENPFVWVYTFEVVEKPENFLAE